MKHVLIVGGGLAGLACAVRLHENGVHVSVLESDDAVGGRVRTDYVDGFALDRGFQVFLDSYPEASQLLDLPRLELRAFKPGALMYRDGQFSRVMDVFRSPWHLVSSAVSPVGSVWDKLRVAALRGRLCRSTLAEIAARKDSSTEEYLRRLWFTPEMIDVFFRSFYGGIFLERELRTSSRMFEFTFKMFSEGSATLPARGIGVIPKQLASRLPAEAIRCGTRVAEVRRDGVTLVSGEKLDADAVVVATDASAAAALVPGLYAGKSPAWRGVAGLYFAASVSPLREAIIALNGSGSGLVNNVCVLSDVAPEYAPPGQALISVSVLGAPGFSPGSDLAGRVQTELEGWFGESVRAWRHLRTDHIAQALPEQPAGDGSFSAGFRVVNGVSVCGDHLASASIEGAITSGLRTAENIMEG